MAHTLPPRRKCQTLQCCINRRLWLCRARAWDRGQEPPPWGHTDSKVSHLSTLLLFFVFLSVGVWSIFELISLDLPVFFSSLLVYLCIFYFFLSCSLTFPATPVIMNNWKAQKHITNTSCFINGTIYYSWSGKWPFLDVLCWRRVYTLWPKVNAILRAGKLVFNGFWSSRLFSQLTAQCNSV